MATGYSLTTHYGGQGLLDSFSFFTGIDPSHGFVDYQSKEDALAKNLVSVDRDYNSVILGVDSNNTYSTSDKGRPSVRLTSHDTFSHGLFIADFHHMPASTCGTWPAFWAFNNQHNGTDWPLGGELEIIEGANTAERNLFSAHTTAGCHAPSTGFSGEQGPTDCSPSDENFGCNYASPPSDTTSYGDSFNVEGGGVYALEWDSEDLKLWHFPRSTIPDDIVYGHVVGPDPSSWGPPHAVFGGSSCKPENYFFNMSLVINTNFCGDYAGNIWGKADQCNQLAPTCEEFVANNPHSFQEAYWDINYIDVYQYGPLTNMTIPPLSPSAASSVTPSTSSATPAPRTPAPSGVTPTFTRTITLSTVLPVETDGSTVDPSIINGYTLLGCFESGASHDSFSQVSSHPGMDNGACVAACAGRKYAGIHSDICYCADTLGPSVAVDSAMCDTQCKGNGREICGGSVASPEQSGSANYKINSAHKTNSSAPASPNHRRDTPAGMLLTVYANLGSEPAPSGAPAMGGRPMDLHPSTPVHNVAVTTALTVTYTTVCPTNPASLIEVEYSTIVTYEDCGCTASKHKTGHPSINPMNVTATIPTTPITTVPMTTHVESCRACGPHGESIITLTVPEAMVTEVVTSITVHTVVPVISNIRNATHTAPIPGTAVPLAPNFKPSASPSNTMPVVAAAPPSRSVSMLEMVGWGVALWFGIFGFMLVL
ncbi:glycoside hydrolase family 16 protein [Annulohypoxylon truncatum]|uniref:glycoside hydrolase family 16 protein n=1 Tax=Annulohypoxylon truncatum TaxID=327061 RepID=UPI0020076AF2|nr:glycoside hydrolase family 16 protein [Annulohypoxylon truncatum]KAI1207953.1 glycoside hydrolase family 16 protein [Annulohypoxylon truncatum]